MRPVRGLLISVDGGDDRTMKGSPQLAFLMLVDLCICKWRASRAHTTMTEAIDKPPNKIRVCVLNSSYEGSDSAFKKYDDICCTPASFFPPDDPRVTFENVEIKKATTYRSIRALVKSGQYDVFYNHCDGARDEDRAGIDVIRSLEEFGVPFTAATSSCYEMPKPEMKMIAHYSNIRSAHHAVLDTCDEIEERCAHLRFPVIVKHVAGYGSIGMTQGNKCKTMEELYKCVEHFISEYQFALVEEFIVGDEVSALACADSSQPDGVLVLHPVKIVFPRGHDFKHFDLKWEETAETMQWVRVDDDDPALQEMLDITRKSFKTMMDGIGYGRCDLRIDRSTNQVYFLEINPNCGIMYPPGLEGSADWILKFNGNGFGHQEFAMLQIQEALRRHQQERLVYRRDFSAKRGFHVRATCDIPKGVVVFRDEGRAFRLVTMPRAAKTMTPEAFATFRSDSWPVGNDRRFYALWDANPVQWRPVNHSCAPNVGYDEDRSLDMVATRAINRGEELTIDYRGFADENSEPFECRCGASSCGGLIQPGQSEKQ